MPVDKHGNRADIVTDSGSTISRMNTGRLYEHYMNSVSRDARNVLMVELGIKEGQKFELDQFTDMFNPTEINWAIDYVLGLYKIVSKRQYEFFSKLPTKRLWEHIMDIVNEQMYFYMYIEREDNNMDVVDTIENSIYRPLYDRVSYVGNSGIRTEETELPIRIAPMYMMLLEKIADDWSSVSFGKLQHFGVLAPTTRSEKFSYPFRNTPVRTIGETEGRIFVGYTGRESIAEMIDRSNNPLTQRMIGMNILRADYPTNIDNIVDRDVVPLGGSKPLQLINHILYTGGFKMTYEPETKYGSPNGVKYK